MVKSAKILTKNECNDIIIDTLYLNGDLMNAQYPFYVYTYTDFYIDHIHDDVSKVRSTKPHTHNVGELIIVEQGESIIAADNKIIHMQSPFVLFIPAYMLHEQTNNPMREYSRYCITIDKKYTDDEDELIPKHFFARGLTAGELDSLLECAKLLLKYCGTKISMNCGMNLRRRKYLILLLLNELAEITSIQTPELYPHTLTRQKRYIDNVCAYIHEHFSENLSLDAIAERFFISRAKLTHDFREAVNMSCGDYISAVRISRAKQLLQEDFPLADVAQRCGYSSSGYFIKCFDRLCGITPAKYREKIRNQDEVDYMIIPDFNHN